MGLVPHGFTSYSSGGWQSSVKWMEVAEIGDCMSPRVLWVTTISLLCPHMAFLPYVHLERGLESLPSLLRALVPSWGSTLMTSFSPNYVSEAPPWVSYWEVRLPRLSFRGTPFSLGQLFLDIVPVEENPSFGISGLLSGKQLLVRILA